MKIPKFLLLENFSWLVQQLSVFDDPNITYKDQGLSNIRGGARRIFRYGSHYQKYYQTATIKKIPPEVKVKFGVSDIDCDQWDISHPSFEDTQMKEKFPIPSDNLNNFHKGSSSPNHYTVLVTSKQSILDKKASRYYVSCTCPDFETTFKEELINYGYTNGMVPAGKGIKKLAPAICKHIYSVLLREYKDILEQEPGAESSAEIHTTVEELPEIVPYQPSIIKQKQNKVKKTEAEKKQEYEILIRKSLKFFSNNMRDAVEVYHNTRQTDNSYKKYKFMIKKYFQGYVIVFTNPQLNPMRDKVREKEIVPILNRTAKGMMPAVDSLIVYTKYFSKDELLNMIKSESRPIQQNQIDKISKQNVKYTLTESIELTTDSSIRTLLLEIC